MEETVQNQNQQGVPAQPQNFNYTVGQNNKKPKSNKLVFVILALLLLIGGGIFILSRRLKDTSTEQAIVSPTPFFSETVEQTPAPTTSSATPSATMRSAVSIEVQNGTGINGEAAYLQTQLKNLGYSKVTTGNAPNQEYNATEVTFGSSVDSAVVSEITAKLKELYQDVSTKTSSTSSTSIVVITGLRKGATAKPSASPSSTPKASPTASVKPTATP